MAAADSTVDKIAARLRTRAVVVALSVSAGASAPATAATSLDGLAQRIEAQASELQTLQRLVQAQAEALAGARRELDALRAAQTPTPPPTLTPTPTPATAPMVGSAAPAAAAALPSTPAGFGGVLTAPGRLASELSLQYGYASSNRIALAGYSVVPAILVGLIDVREVKRSTTTAAATLRWGAGQRVELEAKLPYVWRSDTSVGGEIDPGNASSSATFAARSRGLGDVEATGRLQLNALNGDEPVWVASLRVKSRTGLDPFEVPTSRRVLGFRNDGIQQALPTGSGFWGLQPGLTVLMPTDPAVFFGGLSYLHSVARSGVVRNTDEVPEPLGRVAPGGIVGLNFGMGLSLNEKSSFTIGYDHASVGRTRLEGQVLADSVRLQLGTLLLGYSHRLASGRSLGLSLGAGLTRDTPDLTLTLRLPLLR